MDISKRRRAVWLGLSGVCAALSTIWMSLWDKFYGLLNLFWSIIQWRTFYDIAETVLSFFFIPLAVFAVIFFTKGFISAKRTALKLTITACIALLGGYIAVVAFKKFDFISVWPIRIACGLAPLLAAYCILLFYDGEKWRRVLCSVLASLTLCASTLFFSAGCANNRRDTIGYSESPNGTHKIVVVRDLTKKWKICVACPVYGLWYKQKDPIFDVGPDVLEYIVWVDEDTAQIDDKHGHPRTITFKQGGLFS